MVFVGDTKRRRHFPPRRTPGAPITRSAGNPFLYLDRFGQLPRLPYRACAPLRSGARDAAPAGSSLPDHPFLHRQCRRDGASSNAALISGRNLLSAASTTSTTPSLYQPGGHVCWLAWRPSCRTPADAGCRWPTSRRQGRPVCSSTPVPPTLRVLMEMVRPAPTPTTAPDPSSLHDVFFRVGGSGCRQGHVSLRINQQVIGDHSWIWPPTTAAGPLDPQHGSHLAGP